MHVHLAPVSVSEDLPAFFITAVGKVQPLRAQGTRIREPAANFATTQRMAAGLTNREEALEFPHSRVRKPGREDARCCPEQAYFPGQDLTDWTELCATRPICILGP
jgi:hypothetical protein